jgi:alanyl-tRNA synthetase
MTKSESIEKTFKDHLIEKQGHKEIQNASLVPLNDPSVLFTTAGMHPLVPYLLGQPHPLGNRLVNIQRCVRTNAIEKIGDTVHGTFFEMLGRWSLGDYFKNESLEYTFDWYTSKDYLGLDPNRIYVTVFKGNESAEKDRESINKWKELFNSVGIKAAVCDGSNTDDPDLRIFPLDMEGNWWGPAGTTGPCGPDSELFYWRGKNKPDFNQNIPGDLSNMFIELCNNVFMSYNKQSDGSYIPLSKNNVDFGAGLERITLIEEFKEPDGSLPIELSIFNTDLFSNAREYLEELSGTSVTGSMGSETKSLRIILDHIRSIIFIIADGVLPSNKDQGYILRRLIRRVMRQGLTLKLGEEYFSVVIDKYIEKYSSKYPYLKDQKDLIHNVVEQEIRVFKITLEKGLREIAKVKTESKLSGKLAFYLYETYGFPLEMSLEEFGVDQRDVSTITTEYMLEHTNHQQNSRIGGEKRFKGGLSDQSVETIKLHTTQHLLLKALQMALNTDVKQKGSNITPERLRLDINLDHKLSDTELKEVENIVNQKIQENLPVIRVEMPKEEAEQLGAEMEFDQKYPEIVSVYFIGSKDNHFSAEFCGGPHVTNTSDIGGIFKISKQEKISSSILRLKGTISK